ncbi:hypothetical protein D3C78_1474070 [compost metagenome]
MDETRASVGADVDGCGLVGLRHGAAEGSEQSVQYLPRVPGLVRRFAEDAAAVWHAATCGDGDHETGKQFRLRCAAAPRLLAVGNSVGAGEFGLWLCTGPGPGLG